MTAQTHLEIKGNLREHPFGELLTEVSEIRLTGSFRLAADAQKAVVYVREGKVIFAVSNARRHRLFEWLLRQNKITKGQLSGIPNFAGDLELAGVLKAKNLLAETEVEDFFTGQAGEILKQAFSWGAGEWIFSPFARIKETIEFKVETTALLLEHARSLSPEAVVRRFKSFQEGFGAKPAPPPNISLTRQEAFILSRFEGAFLTVAEVKNVSALSDLETLQILYALWLAGFLFRQNWQTAFAEHKVSAIRAARLSLKKETVEEAPKSAPEIKSDAEKIAKVAANNASRLQQVDSRQALESYLQRVEEAGTYYDVLQVGRAAPVVEIKTAYFALAKQFHPDKFYRETDMALQQRIQSAFTELAKAYDTLKEEGSRELYDFRLRKHLASMETGETAAESQDVLNDMIEEGRKSFEAGCAHVLEEQNEKAVSFFARAAQLVPDNARYHAHYGKILAGDEKTRHKAESALQTAVRLDPQNSAYRLMLAEFYARIGLPKRAEGELQRLLAQFPDNAEARALLDSLAQKQ